VPEKQNGSGTSFAQTKQDDCPLSFFFFFFPSPPYPCPIAAIADEEWWIEGISERIAASAFAWRAFFFFFFFFLSPLSFQTSFLPFLSRALRKRSDREPNWPLYSSISAFFFPFLFSFLLSRGQGNMRIRFAHLRRSLADSTLFFPFYFFFPFISLLFPFPPRSQRIRDGINDSILQYTRHLLLASLSFFSSSIYRKSSARLCEGGRRAIGLFALYCAGRVRVLFFFFFFFFWSVPPKQKAATL